MHPAQGAVALPGGVYPVEFHRPGIECQQAVSQKLACENLPLEAQDAPLGERLACHDAGVVDEILGGKIVRAIHDKVIFSDNIQDIICRKVLMIGVDVDMGGIFRSFSPAESTLLRPTSGVKWITWRCRLESSTVSPSAMPIIPTPAAAR